jgi:hypothetical protein
MLKQFGSSQGRVESEEPSSVMVRLKLDSNVSTLQIAIKKTRTDVPNNRQVTRSRRFL